MTMGTLLIPTMPIRMTPTRMTPIRMTPTPTPTMIMAVALTPTMTMATMPIRMTITATPPPIPTMTMAAEMETITEAVADKAHRIVIRPTRQVVSRVCLGDIIYMIVYGSQLQSVTRGAGQIIIMSAYDERHAPDGLQKLDSQAIGAIYDKYFTEVYRLLPFFTVTEFFVVARRLAAHPVSSF